MSLYAFISLLYKQLLQYTLLKSFTLPSALLTKFPKMFHMILLASDIIFTKLSTKTLLLWRRRASFEYQGLLQDTPASFFLSMFKLHCKRHYRKLATYSWCRTWREHVTKTAPARRRHSVGGGGGGAPISYDRRRRRQQNVGGGGAAAAAHSSIIGCWRASRLFSALRVQRDKKLKDRSDLNRPTSPYRSRPTR